jgi:hypothetical protein
MKKIALAVLLAACCGAPAHATPLACASPCSITTTSAGYVLPVTEIASGAQVKWVTTEASHPTSNSTDGDTRCFLQAVSSSVVPAPVRFDLAPSGLYATTFPGTDHEATVLCPNTTALPNGALLLTFRCMLHTWMNGVLAVEP